MTSVLVQETVKLELYRTWCGHFIALPPERLETLRETGEKFFCPYGHQGVFGKSENVRLKRELAEAQQMANAQGERALQAEAMLKAVEARRDARSVAGVCQHCHRHFLNVERHMATKHPMVGSKR